MSPTPEQDGPAAWTVRARPATNRPATTGIEPIDVGLDPATVGLDSATAGVDLATCGPASDSGCSHDPAFEAIALVLRAAHRLRSLFALHCGTVGLSDVRFAVLRILRDCAPHGCTQTELAGRLEQSESSVSALIDRMREDNLVYRLRSKTDRRKRLLLSTEHGRKTLAEAEQRHGQLAAGVCACFDAAQMLGLIALLRPLVAELGRLEADGSPATESPRHAPPPHFLPQSRPA